MNWIIVGIVAIIIILIILIVLTNGEILKIFDDIFDIFS